MTSSRPRVSSQFSPDLMGHVGLIGDHLQQCLEEGLVLQGKGLLGIAAAALGADLGVGTFAEKDREGAVMPWQRFGWVLYC